MLEQLQVRNLALTKEATVNFEPQMTCITGETGAGKSLLVDALSLILGARADVNMIKDGQDKLEIEAVFTIEPSKAKDYLVEHDLIDDGDQDLIIRRIISADGKSKAQINSHTVNLTVLRELGAYLVSIHGQHASIKIIDENNQLDLLDAFAALQPMRQDLAHAFNEYNKQRGELTDLSNLQKDLASIYKTLRYQQEVLTSLDLKAGDYEKLEQDFDKAMHQNKIYNALALAFSSLGNEEHNIIDILQARLNSLRNVLQYESSVQKAMTPLENAINELVDCKDNLEILIDAQAVIDPLAIEQKMSKCHELARNFKIAPQDLYLKKGEIDTKIENFLTLKEKIAKKTQKVKELREIYEQKAKALSEIRIKKAQEMSQCVTSIIHTLAMKDGVFKVLIDYDETIRPRITGRDNVKFLFSANLGQDLKDIGAVASGGELSRLALAIEAITSTNHATPTIVFDEVDTGISGVTASSVGKLLHDLSLHVQVLTVTHLPQVAACAQHQFLVSKSTVGGITNSKIEALDRVGRIKELSRMMGGNVITDATLQSAAALLDSNS